MSPETCPHCGADIPRGARSCPHCGADERTGWSERADADRLGISDPEDFDHGEFMRREFGGDRAARRPAWVWVVAVILLLALVAWWIR